MASIRLEEIDKTYPNGQRALRAVNLWVAEGDLLVLVGPSGCGKSTALRVVAGLEAPSRGRVWIADQDVTELPPPERDVAMVFQSYALYPHQTVRANLGFGLRMRGAAPALIERRVREVAARLGLEQVLDRRPAELSGGQRQRVALGRALARCRGDEEGGRARDPHALLLDEPLSNLDAKLRLEMRAELARLHRELGATMLYVTHDQEEAMTLGDRLAVLNSGRLEQVAAPLELYQRPASVFVADFIGVPPINWFRGRIRDEPTGRLIACDGLTLSAPPAIPARSGQEVVVGIRPHDLELTPANEANLIGTAEVIEALGSTAIVHARTETGLPFRVPLPAEHTITLDETIAVRLPPSRLHIFDASTEMRLGGPAR